MYERRSNRRFSIYEKVNLCTPTEVLSGSVEDFGRGGFQLSTDRPLTAHNRLSFALRSAFLSEPLEGVGRVRYVKNVRKYGRPMYVSGIQFTSVNRRRVAHYIGRIHGWRRSPLLSSSRREELAVILKSLPVLLAASWLIAAVFLNAYNAHIEERRYAQKFQDALIYGLYHMD